LAGVEAYGFRTSNLFAQEIWFPEGRARLFQVGALFAATATGLLIVGPWSFAGLAAVLRGGGYLVLPRVRVACGAVALYLLSAWSWAGSWAGVWRCRTRSAYCLAQSFYIFAMPFRGARLE
jgi:hypothetical protein